MNQTARVVTVVAIGTLAKILIPRALARAAYNHHLETLENAPVGSEYYMKHAEMMSDPKMQSAFKLLDTLKKP